MSGARRGFTLIEVLAAVVILGVGITAALTGFSAIGRSEARAREIEKMHRLATEKLDELRAITDTFAAGDNGDFADRGEPNYVWRLDVGATGIQDLDGITLTVQRANATDRSPEVKLSVLVHRPPAPEEVAP